MNIYYTKGEITEALNIMCEAALWLKETNRELWQIDELHTDSITNPSEEFIVMRNETESIAAMILSFTMTDVDRYCWVDIPMKQSAYIHKLSVRRQHAAKGMADLLITYAKESCKQANIPYLRLDCDAKRDGLMTLYRRNGFELIAIKSINSKRHGDMEIALFEICCLD
ncbi:MAG: GNAT family N-acetyltransferase [Oscillospiraceae bacterium]|nr:GNAT family N-acetyltransferase [Oscillospiraceae bacterium]